MINDLTIDQNEIYRFLSRFANEKKCFQDPQSSI